MTKQVFETKTVVPNHSTVTECVRYDVLCQNSLNKNNDYILDLSFTLSIRTSKLTKTSHYTSYQQKLYIYKKNQIMKNLLFTLLLTIPFVGFGQGMKITWVDNSGIEFSISTQTKRLNYLVDGGKIEYNNDNIYDRENTGPNGTVRKIGSVKIEYNNDNIYDRENTGPDGTIRNVGSVKIEYNNNNMYDRKNTGPDGTIRRVGGLTVEYNNDNIYDRKNTGPDGTVRETSGSVN